MKFIDEALIEISSGHGGPGAVHFRREKFAPKMGPDGGDGGRGGSVYFEADTNLQSLLDFKYTSKFEAENGRPGEGKDCNGKAGEDCVVRVPVGTVIRDADSGQFLCDLLEPGLRVLLLKGGRGGQGNMNFATAVRQAPDFAQPVRRGITSTLNSS
jgi:GTP-binding protein